MTRPWRQYSLGGKLPCPPDWYVDVCEGDDVCMDVPAHQSFDKWVTHWRPTIFRPSPEKGQ